MAASSNIHYLLLIACSRPLVRFPKASGKRKAENYWRGYYLQILASIPVLMLNVGRPQPAILFKDKETAHYYV